MHKLYMNVFRWKKAAIGTKAALVGGPQLIFFCRVPALATGSLAAASFPLFVRNREQHFSLPPDPHGLTHGNGAEDRG